MKKNRINILVAAIALTCTLSAVAMDIDLSCEAQTSRLQSIETGKFYRKGTRKEKKMEDRFAISLISKYFEPQKKVETDVFLGVYDGHGGSQVSQYLADNLHHRVVEHLGKEKDVSKAIEAIKFAYKSCEQNSEKFPSVGSTAVAGLLLDNQLLIANVGDSRAVICWSEGKEDKYSCTKDHKPDDSEEKKRIESEGGFVHHYGVWRVGNLAVSRSIGDSPKATGLSAEPDILIFTLNPDYKFVIFASDGVWDVISSEEASKFVKNVLKLGRDAQKASESLLKKAQERGSIDDLTVVIIRFRW